MTPTPSTRFALLSWEVWFGALLGCLVSATLLAGPAAANTINTWTFNPGTVPTGLEHMTYPGQSVVSVPSESLVTNQFGVIELESLNTGSPVLLAQSGAFPFDDDQNGLEQGADTGLPNGYLYTLQPDGSGGFETTPQIDDLQGILLGGRTATRVAINFTGQGSGKQFTLRGFDAFDNEVSATSGTNPGGAHLRLVLNDSQARIAYFQLDYADNANYPFGITAIQIETVPEPATASLLGLGLAAFAALRANGRQRSRGRRARSGRARAGRVPLRGPARPVCG